MSIKLMAAAWELDIPLTEKMVLLCLCDHANDAGECWPSVETLARKCSISGRSVQRSIRKLTAIGMVALKPSNGRKANWYCVSPTLTQCHPDTVSPRHSVAVNPDNGDINPDTVSPKPSRTISEPSKNNIARKPDGVSDVVWADFSALRKAKRAPLTETALASITREASAAGWSLEAALSECSARGWQAFKASWVKEAPNGNGNSRPQRSTTRQTGERVAARFAARGGGASDIVPRLGAPGRYD